MRMMGRCEECKWFEWIEPIEEREEDAKRLADEAHEYLQRGVWVTTEKVM